jgi:cysteinyl-tRNA synthetase
MLLKQKKLERASIDALVQERAQARQNKDFSKSDELRKQLTEMGIAVQDGPQGSEWEVQK